jgi:hypothetical protein
MKSKRYDLHDHGLKVFDSLHSPRRRHQSPSRVEEGYVEM